jgi:hypothetical protein
MKEICSFNAPGKDGRWSSEAVRRMAEKADREYTLIYDAPERTEVGWLALERMAQVAGDSAAGMAYADYYERKGDVLRGHPLVDYRKGSLRDDFDFGPLALFRTQALKEAAAEMGDDYRFAGLYDLRLKVARKWPLTRIPEFLSTLTAGTGSDEAPEANLFGYVDPANREVQGEMERACCDHLKRIGAYLPRRRKTIDPKEGRFPVEASVVIPVRNRARTIADALASALEQETRFAFNLIVVDNHSTDGTTQEIRRFAGNKRLAHVVPQRKDLGIGGCWNVAIHRPECGKFAVQLDSDDVYSSPHSLQTIVEAFYAQRCALLTGTYRTTDASLHTIAPGVVDHAEWTPDNGHNNALRIHGLGAPRAFYTPALRSMNLPNVSYGEDYAACLRLCREYAVGRIYEVLYLCRRWEGNSDASQDVAKRNEQNAYKDLIRTWELEARIQMNQRHGNGRMA